MREAGCNSPVTERRVQGKHRGHGLYGSRGGHHLPAASCRSVRFSFCLPLYVVASTNSASVSIAPHMPHMPANTTAWLHEDAIVNLQRRFLPDASPGSLPARTRSLGPPQGCKLPRNHISVLPVTDSVRAAASGTGAVQVAVISRRQLAVVAIARRRQGTGGPSLSRVPVPCYYQAFAFNSWHVLRTPLSNRSRSCTVIRMTHSSTGTRRRRFGRT